MTRVRFAPTLTRPLYLDAARMALVNHRFARRDNGHLSLRLDDLTDPGHPDPIIQDLVWLGVTWDGIMRQSERRDRYQDVFGSLERDGFVYPCFETEEELKAKQAFRLRRGQSGIYDRAMLRLTEKQRRDAEAGGKRPHWRFKLSGDVISWRDLVQGHREVALSTVSDPVVMRADGTPTPIFASLVDDIDNQTTHILRGEDNLGNTGIQLELLALLTGRTNAIRFGHLTSETARPRPQAVRHGPASVRGLRQDGVQPAVLAACLLGQPETEPLRLSDLKAPRFDMGALLAANRAALAEMPFAAVADHLPPNATEAFWLAIRGSIDLLKEARGWWDVVAGSIVPPVVEDEHALLRQAAELLPPEPWAADVGTAWLAALRQATGRDGAALDLPLRLALTGEETGPDLAALLPLMGRARAVARLDLAAA